MKGLIVLILCLAYSQGENLSGRREGRIVGGSEILIADAPYQASLHYFSTPDSDEFFCGGKITHDIQQALRIKPYF